MRFSLEEVARAIGAELPAGQTGRMAEGWSIDSRTLQGGDVFFALRGPHYDGHAYVAEVLRKGALAAVVRNEIAALDHAADGAGRVLRVADPQHALESLAAWARRQWRGQVVAVTGSAGKTTTKEIIAEMLSVNMITAKSEGNLNNHIGLPLSLLRLPLAAKVAVLEMGMNHGGEIRQLARIAAPDVGLVTNVGYAHLENFASIEGVAAAKRELVEELPSGGTAVLNADDPLVARFRESHSKCVMYGTSPLADVRGQDVEETAEGSRFRVADVEFATSLNGRHNVSNILAGIALAQVYGIAAGQLVETVRNLKPGKMRGERIIHDGICILNDSYNSNPEAVRAMLEVLHTTPATKRIAVLGEMLELGGESAALHQQVGRYAAQCGVDVLIGVQGATREMLTSAKQAGVRETFYFDHSPEAGDFAKSLAVTGDAILFKGSRGTRVERALERFLASTGKGGQG